MLHVIKKTEKNIDNVLILKYNLNSIGLSTCSETNYFNQHSSLFVRFGLAHEISRIRQFFEILSIRDVYIHYYSFNNGGN